MTKKSKEASRNSIDDHAKQTDAAAGQENLNLFLTNKKRVWKFQQTDRRVKDKKGNSLTTTEEQLERRAEHLG